MRVIQSTRDNQRVFEVAWMWLPTFIGQNTALLHELDSVLRTQFPPPLEANADVLDQIHDYVIEWVCSRIKIPGLEKYLQAIRFVHEAVALPVPHGE